MLEGHIDGAVRRDVDFQSRTPAWIAFRLALVIFFVTGVWLLRYTFLVIVFSLLAVALFVPPLRGLFSSPARPSRGLAGGIAGHPHQRPSPTSRDVVHFRLVDANAHQYDCQMMLGSRGGAFKLGDQVTVWGRRTLGGRYQIRKVRNEQTGTTERASFGGPVLSVVAVCFLAYACWTAVQVFG